MVAAAKGYHFLCVTDPSTSALSVEVIKALGSEVVAGGTSGTLAAATWAAGSPTSSERLARTRTWSGSTSTRTRRTGPCTSGARRRRSPPRSRVDFLFVGTGTSGTLMGCITTSAGLAGTRIIAVDAVGSVTFGTAGRRRGSSPGSGPAGGRRSSARNWWTTLELVSEADTVRTCRWLARRYGLFAGGSTGSVVLGGAVGARPNCRRARASWPSHPDLGEPLIRTDLQRRLGGREIRPGLPQEPADPCPS